MTTRLRFLLLLPLLWLTLLALPAGAQAAAMPPCHHVQAQPGAEHVRQMHAMHRQAGARAACGQGNAHNHGRDHDRGHCANCPACCAAVALAPAPPAALPAAGPAFVAIPFRAGHLPSVDPVLPERPPRHRLA